MDSWVCDINDNIKESWENSSSLNLSIDNNFKNWLNKNIKEN